tara:strand:+ start:16159 stop:16422 length:264 start_codon:yes stop_codon:yes gene_type:complete
MKYWVVSKNGHLSAVKEIRKDVQSLAKQGYAAVGRVDSKEKAQEMIMGIKAHAVVEKFAGHLPQDMKKAFKSEIAQIAADMYNQIVK